MGSATLFIPSDRFEFNQFHQTILNLTTSGTISIHYKIIRKEQRESGMFPSITQGSAGIVAGENENERNSFFNYEFSPTFCPSLPMNFKLLSVKKEKKVICQCDFEGPFEKPRNNLTKEPGVLQICYFNIPQDKFSQIHSEYLYSYFDRLKQSTEIMNSQLMMEKISHEQEKDITSLFKKGKYSKVLEHTCKVNTTDGLLTVLTFSCLVGDSMMALFRYVSYSFEQRIRITLIEIMKQSKIVPITNITCNSITNGGGSINNYYSPPSPTVTSSSSSSSSSPSSDRVMDVGSLSSLMDDENCALLCSPSRLLSSNNSIH